LVCSVILAFDRIAGRKNTPYNITGDYAYVNGFPVMQEDHDWVHLALKLLLIWFLAGILLLGGFL
jgi:hypothetical protein